MDNADHSDAAPDAGLVVHIDSWSHTDQAKIRITPAFADELRAELDLAGLRWGNVFEFSAEQSLVAIGVSLVGSAAAWATISRVVVAIVRRHDGKEVSIDHQRMTVSGYSVDDACRIVEVAATAGYTRGQANWQRITGDNDNGFQDEDTLDGEPPI